MILPYNNIGLYLSILEDACLYWTILGNIGQCLSISESPEENFNSFCCSDPEQYLAIFFTILDNIWDNISQYFVILDNIV